MKKDILAYCCFCFLLLASPIASGEKFSSSFDNQQNLKNNIPLTQSTPPSLPTTPQSSSSLPQAPTAPSATYQDASLTDQTVIPATPSVPASVQNPQAIIPAFGGRASAPSVPVLKPPKITLPTTYEKQFQIMLAAQAQARAQKKKTFYEAIYDEIMRYGLFIVLGFVALLVVYALRKDKEAEKFQPSETSPEEKKKDIWHEEF
jgi:hypothetical protein